MSHPTPSSLDEALALAAKGFWVLPVKSKQKIPQIKEWQKLATTDQRIIRDWWGKWPNANVGIATGEESNLLVLDVDADADKDLDGNETLDQLEQRYAGLPPTIEVLTPRGGRHLYFQYLKGQDIRNSAGALGEGLDIRGEGGYVVAPPSVLLKGRPYAWDVDHHPDETPLAAPPDWLLALLMERVSTRQQTGTPTMNGDIPKTQRNVTLTSLAGTMRRAGMDAEEIDAVLQVINTRRCTPPLSEAEVRTIAHSIATYPAGPAPDNGSPASPTRTPPPWPDSPDEKVYHGLAGEFVRLIAPHSEADPMALLLQFLAALGSVIGRSAYFVAESTRHYLTLFLVIVGMTSKARKGSSWSHVKRIFEGCDLHWASDRVKGGLSSGEGLIWQVRDPIYKSEPIKEKGKHTGEYQEICVDLGVEDKRLLVQEAEFSSVLRMTDRDGNTLSPIVRKAWETGDLESLTKNSPAKATNAHISIVGHIVQDEVRRYLGRTEAGNGFANRFLWVCAKRSKILPEGGQLTEVDVASFVKRLKQAIKTAKGTGELKRDEGAKAIWHKVYGKLSEGATGLFGAVTSRAEAQVMRLACLYALLDGCSVIKSTHLKAALAVWEYCEASARHIWGDALGDPVADDILSALRGSPTGHTRTQISDLFGRNRNKDQIGRALATLLEHGHVRQESEKPEGKGRSIERWFAI